MNTSQQRVSLREVKIMYIRGGGGGGGGGSALVMTNRCATSSRFHSRQSSIFIHVHMYFHNTLDRYM